MAGIFQGDTPLTPSVGGVQPQEVYVGATKVWPTGPADVVFSEPSPVLDTSQWTSDPSGRVYAQGNELMGDGGDPPPDQQYSIWFDVVPGASYRFVLPKGTTTLGTSNWGFETASGLVGLGNSFQSIDAVHVVPDSPCRLYCDPTVFNATWSVLSVLVELDSLPVTYLFNDPEPIVNTAQWTSEGNLYPFTSNGVLINGTVTSSSNNKAHSLPFSFVAGKTYRVEHHIGISYGNISVDIVEALTNTVLYPLGIYPANTFVDVNVVATLSEDVRVRCSPNLWPDYDQIFQIGTTRVSEV